MSRPTAVLLCPGRGSYGREELGSLAKRLRPGAVWDAVAHADALRQQAGRPTLTALDSAEAFRPGLHLDGENAAELIYFATLAHVEDLRDRFDVLAVVGNSLGWYTALVAAGALPPSDGAELVRTMARLQRLARGGQVLTTVVDGDWRRDAELEGELDVALRQLGEHGPDFLVARSIRLGGHEVLGGTDAGLAMLLELLPRVETEARTFPFRLAGNGPFHTPLCDGVAAAASAELGALPIDVPEVHLVDGRGELHTPWSADPAVLRSYTLDTQVRTTFDFTAAVRTAIREIQPEVLLCAGPGASLRAPVGHVVIAERWRGIESRDALFASGVVRVD
ncbi:MAG: ACP S-malonyltransferase [Planctomycetes bacterium]|nr:ACP S-malonyltransferase [Planctomycetota bacterium]